MSLWRSNADLARWSDNIQGNVVMRCSSQGDMLGAVRAGLGISALSCFVADARISSGSHCRS